jgi:hypothetical protein
MGTPGLPDADDAEGLPDALPVPDARLSPMADAALADARIPDATLPDATPRPTAIVAMDAESLVVTRAAKARLTVTLDFPAPAEGTSVLIAVDGGALMGPGMLVVPAGASSAQLTLDGVSPGLATVRASLGESFREATIRVVPMLTSLASESTDILVGTVIPYTVILEAQTDVDVEVRLGSDMPGMAQVARTATIPAGMDRVSFDVTGVELGGRIEIRASIGEATVRRGARVLGLFLSEILYDVNGDDTGKEWIELYNATDTPLDVSNVMVAVATSGPYTRSLTLAGTIAPLGCILVGGPTLDTTMQQGGFSYFNSTDFTPDLGNAGTKSGDPGDGLSLWAKDGSAIDNVIYGRNNNGKIQDEDGLQPTVPDVGDASTDQSIERKAPGLQGAWAIQPAPSPGRCALSAM